MPIDKEGIIYPEEKQKKNKINVKDICLIITTCISIIAPFTISAKQAVREQRIPFDVSMNIPNAETICAIEDVRNGRNLSRGYSSVEELMEDLNADDEINI